MPTKIIVKKTEGPVTEILKAKTPGDTNADIRDSLSYFAGRGLTGLVDDEARKQYSTLVNTVGRDKAQQLANQVFLHNQRPDAARLSPEQRISSFYSIGSSTPEVQGTLDKVKSLGYGVLPGYRNSSLLGNMILSGKEAPISTPNAENENLKKIKLFVKNLPK